MKKIGDFFRNIYRIKLVKPGGRMYSQILNGDSDKDESKLRTLLQNDPDNIDPDPEIFRLLEQRVAAKKQRVSENSISGVFTLLFSIKNIELKMAVLSVVLIVSLGINPGVNYQVNRKLNPFFLADTLRDSIRLEPQFFDQGSEQR